MQILVGVLILIGFVAGFVALGILIYVLPHAPYKSPDWMTVLLRSFQPHIIAYFVLFALSAMALGLAAYIGKHAPWPDDGRDKLASGSYRSDWSLPCRRHRRDNLGLRYGAIDGSVAEALQDRIVATRDDLG